jgi:hypothetical protein
LRRDLQVPPAGTPEERRHSISSERQVTRNSLGKARSNPINS